MITGWTDPKRDALHRRALELQPAAALAAMRTDEHGLAILYSEYLEGARDLGICVAEAWAIYSSAALNWVMLLIDERAARDHVSIDQAAQTTILATQEWVALRG